MYEHNKIQKQQSGCDVPQVGARLGSLQEPEIEESRINQQMRNIKSQIDFLEQNIECLSVKISSIVDNHCIPGAEDKAVVRGPSCDLENRLMMFVDALANHNNRLQSLIDNVQL